MAKTKVFISHIQENSSIAKGIKEFIDTKFLGAVKVFVSSDGDIPPGDTWQERIIKEIKESDIVIVICTNASIHRPWINFEAGGALVLGACVIPICWHGCRIEYLPPPLGNLQSLDLEFSEHIQQLMQTIALKADMRIPEYNPNDLIQRLPKRYTEKNDLAPSMFLGLDIELPTGLRLEKEYGIKRRKILIKPERKFFIQINESGKSTFLIEETVIYFEHQDLRTLKIYLSSSSDTGFDELDFQIENATIIDWQRHTDSIVSVEINPNDKILLLRPYTHKYSWKPPLIWGKDFDTISIPIEQPTGKHFLCLESLIPIEKVIAFKDIVISSEGDEEVAKRALKIKDYNCPPVLMTSSNKFEWQIELPEIQAVYRIVLFYKGSKYLKTNSK